MRFYIFNKLPGDGTDLGTTVYQQSDKGTEVQEGVQSLVVRVTAQYMRVERKKEVSSGLSIWEGYG